MSTFVDLSLLYETFHFPMFRYAFDQTLQESFSGELRPFAPIRSILLKGFVTEGEVVFLKLNNFKFFGLIRLAEDQSLLMIGPVTAFHYDRESLVEFTELYEVPAEQQHAFRKFLRSAPVCSEQQFLQDLLLMARLLNGSLLSPEDNRKEFLPVSRKGLARQIYDQYIERREENWNAEYRAARRLYGMIRDGAYRSLAMEMQDGPMVHFGVGSIDAMTLSDLNVEVRVDLEVFGIAGLEGGLAVSEVRSILDPYFQKLDLGGGVDMLRDVYLHAALTICRQVASSIPLDSERQDILAIYRYIRDNLYHPLSVEKIADALGYNSSYLSRKFKQETGRNLSDFLLECRLRESQLLLKYSEREISEISSILGFSSQSHFQTCFKKRFGVTPGNYRQGNYS